jgi:predicted RNA-binding Zn-ribbon protein involved in translation (DUF1610 family)
MLGEAVDDVATEGVWFDCFLYGVRGMLGGVAVFLVVFLVVFFVIAFEGVSGGIDPGFGSRRFAVVGRVIGVHGFNVVVVVGLIFFCRSCGGARFWRRSRGRRRGGWLFCGGCGDSFPVHVVTGLGDDGDVGARASHHGRQ